MKASLNASTGPARAAQYDQDVEQMRVTPPAQPLSAGIWPPSRCEQLHCPLRPPLKQTRSAYAARRKHARRRLYQIMFEAHLGEWREEARETKRCRFSCRRRISRRLGRRRRREQLAAHPRRPAVEHRPPCCAPSPAATAGMRRRRSRAPPHLCIVCQIKNISN